jgi:flagellar protein FliS
MSTYRHVGVQSAIDDASPHRLITMLLNGALDHIAAARGAMDRGDTATQGSRLGKSITIIDNLRASLDHEQGGELAGRLAALYDYMERRLLEASRRTDTAILDEVASLLREIKTGWDGIPAEYR